jgi:hypothetical protein
MSTNLLKKVVIAIALTLAVMFSAGPWEDMTGLPFAASAQACGGPSVGSGGGGGC